MPRWISSSIVRIVGIQTQVTVVGLEEEAGSGTFHLPGGDAQVLTSAAVDPHGRVYASFGPYGYRLAAFTLETP